MSSFDELPSEIISNVLYYLEFDSYTNLRIVCKNIYWILKDSWIFDNWVRTSAGGAKTMAVGPPLKITKEEDITFESIAKKMRWNDYERVFKSLKITASFQWTQHGMFRGTCFGDTPITVKEVPKDLVQDPREFSRIYANIVSAPVHEHLVKVLAHNFDFKPFKGIVTNGRRVITPFYDQTLYNYATHKANVISDATTIRILHDVALGLQHLHKNGVVHGRFQEDKVFLNISPERIRAVVGGHRSVQFRPQEDKKGNISIALKWAAPETVKNRLFSAGTDVWAYGVTIEELLTRCFEPYPELEPIQVAVRVTYESLRLKVPADSISAALAECCKPLYEMCFGPIEGRSMDVAIALLDKAMVKLDSSCV